MLQKLHEVTLSIYPPSIACAFAISNDSIVPFGTNPGSVKAVHERAKTPFTKTMNSPIITPAVNRDHKKTRKKNPGRIMIGNVMNKLQGQSGPRMHKNGHTFDEIVER